MRRRSPSVVLLALALASSLSLASPANATVSDPPAGTAITGADGILYPAAPLVVTGTSDELFLGLELDRACSLGTRFDRALRRLGTLANLIEKSGRRVVLVVPPDKSTMLTSRLDSLPHGDCDRIGLRHQRRSLQRFDEPTYLPLIDALERRGDRTYWRTDQHWTSNGTATMATEVARRLDRRLARQLRFRPVDQTTWGLLNRMRDDPATETVTGLQPAGRVRVHVPGAPDDAVPGITFDHSWSTSPARRTWPGRTLLLGDSFSFVGLENLRPVFRHGRFLWVGHTPLATIAAAIGRADTVVIESVQVLVSGSDLASRALRREVRSAVARPVLR